MAVKTTVQKTEVKASEASLLRDPTNILTPKELSKRLKVKPSWVYESTRRRSRNSLPFIRMGRYLRFNWLDIVEWLESHRVSA